MRVVCVWASNTRKASRLTPNCTSYSRRSTYVVVCCRRLVIFGPFPSPCISYPLPNPPVLPWPSLLPTQKGLEAWARTRKLYGQKVGAVIGAEASSGCRHRPPYFTPTHVCSKVPPITGQPIMVNVCPSPRKPPWHYNIEDDSPGICLFLGRLLHLPVKPRSFTTRRSV